MQTIRFPMGSFPNNSPSFESKKRIKILELYGLFRISVKIVYQDDTSDSFGELTKFRGSLNLSDDKLIQVDYCAKYHLDYICLRTLKGRIIKAGEAGIDIKSFIFPAYASIIGFFCNYGRFIFQFGLIVQENSDLKLSLEIEEQKKKEEEEQNAITLQRDEAAKKEKEELLRIELEIEEKTIKTEFEKVGLEENIEEGFEEKAKMIKEYPEISREEEEKIEENSGWGFGDFIELFFEFICFVLDALI